MRPGDLGFYDWTAKDANPLNSEEVKCKVISIDAVDGTAYVVVKSTGIATHIPLDGTLFFWKNIKKLDKYLGFFNVGKSLVRNGGYTANNKKKTRKRKH